MYKCNNCGEIFERLSSVWVDVGKLYMVDNPYNTRATMECCPYCESIEFESYYDDEEEY